MRTTNKVLPVAALALILLGATAGAQGLRLSTSTSAAPSASARATPQDAMPADRDGIAAVVGKQVITDYDLAVRVRAAAAQLAARGSAVSMKALRSEVLDDMINQLALAQFARESGIEVGNATLQLALKQTAENFKLDVPELRRQIEAQGLSWNQYKEQLEREILIARLRQRDVASRVTVSDQEVDDYLAQQARQQQAPQGKLTLAQIFIPLPSHPSAAQVAAARARIDAALALLRQGHAFAQVARADSEGAEARDGGLLGTRDASEWPSLFVNAVRGLQPGQVSEVIRSGAGFHILQLVAAPQAKAPAAAATMQAHVREIVLRIDAGHPRASVLHELQQVRDAVLEGKVTFSAKAREISQAIASAGKGGDIGWVLPGELPPALDTALDRLNPGQVSTPIALPDVGVLLQLVDRREHALDARQQRAVARNILLQRKVQREFAEFVQDVRARTYVRLPNPDS